MDINGRVVKTIKLSQSTTELDISGINDGLWIVRVKTNSSVSNQKVVIHKGM